MNVLRLFIAAGLFTAIAVDVAAEELKINTKGGLSIATADGEYSVKLGGRIQYDYNYAEQNGVADEDNFGIRRARLFVSGAAGEFSYKAQFNIGNNNGGTPEDLYIRYNGWGKKAKLTVGRQKMPFGLEELMSSKDISILERSAITERYALGRHDGIQLQGANGDFTYAFAAFEDDDANGDDFGSAGRLTWNPVKSDNVLIHLGAAYTDRGGPISALGLEAAVVSGPFHIQAEYMDAEENRVDVDGYYIQAGWVITGESRPYKGGVFKKVKGKGKAGAVELVFRYEDGDGNHSDIELGTTDASAYGIGLNWYYNSNVRLGINYTEGEDNRSNDEGSEFRVRAQFTF